MVNMVNMVCRFQKRYTILTLFLTGLGHFCLYEKSFFVKHQPKLYLVDVWYQTSTKTLSGWCLISNVNQNCISWLMFDIKCQPELHLVDIWYQSSIQWLLIYDWYSYTLSICFLCISGYVDSKKRIQFWHFFWLDFVIFACMKNHSSSNINQNCTWLMFDIKRQPKLYLVDVWYQMLTRTASGWCLISNVNQNSIWLMFDINHQSGGYWFMIDIHIL